VHCPILLLTRFLYDRYVEGTASKWSQQQIPEAVKGINSCNNPTLSSVETLNQADKSLCSNIVTSTTDICLT
jgi:hypothetical protein